jgi:hypothetical protein
LKSKRSHTGRSQPGRPEVLGEGEERRVRLEEVEARLQPVVQLDLQLDRVGLQVDQAAGLGVLGPRLGARRAG